MTGRPADPAQPILEWAWDTVPDAAIDDLHARLARFQLPPRSPSTGWDRGVPLEYLESIVRYWSDSFDWRAQEARIHSYPWVRREVGDRTVTAIHQRSARPAGTAVVLLHGWPDSILRFERVLPLLGDLDVVVPCLPGFPGAAPNPATAATPSVMADEVAGLMSELGYARYVVSGGDVGSVVARIMATRYPEQIAALHVTDLPAIRLPGQIRRDLSEPEEQYLQCARRWRMAEGGYLVEQATKPHTLAAALSDSPVGLAAWIIEKLHGWSDCDGDVESVFTRDDLLTWVSIYWFTRTIGTSFDPYSALAMEFSHVSTPTAVTMFARDLVPAPREYVERFFDVRSWQFHETGGHFAAWERPAEYAAGIRAALAAVHR